MLRKLIGAGAVAAFAFGSMIPSASAHQAAAFVGTFSTPGSLMLVGLGAPNDSSWRLSGFGSLVQVDGGGALTGNCGLSGGSGTATLGSHVNVGVNLSGYGDTIVLTANAGTAVWVLKLGPLPPPGGGVACVTEPAVEFVVTGFAADV